MTVHHLPLQGDALVAALKDADVAVLVRDRTPFDAALLAQLPKLRYLVFTGNRNATLDLAVMAARNIPVSHTDWGPSKDSTCELTWSLILGATRQLEQQTALLWSGAWRPRRAVPLAGVLHGQTLGLIGLGEIGGRVVKVGNALGMKVITWSPRMTPERALEKRRTVSHARRTAKHIQSRQPAPGADCTDTPPAQRRTPGPDAP